KLLSQGRGTRLMFEPFQAEFVPAARDFPYALYLRPGEEHSAQQAYARTVFEGRMRHPWIDRSPQPRFVRRRLVKEVRASLWLRWLGCALPGLKTVMLLRHPCAAADSLRVLGWPSRLQGFFQQPKLVEDHLEPLLEVMRSTRSIFEEHIVVWCIQHYVALRQASAGDLLLTFYERFVLDRDRELGRVLAYVGWPPIRTGGGAMSDAAWTTRPDSLAQRGTQPRLIDDWVTRVSASERRRATEIVAAFGLGGIYGDETRPDAEQADRLLAAATPARS
ncbi:MAG: hypothetical protein JOZ89_03050, partial [Gammaproteobacteria bacterium]|nr:hypothetical protein [Gammaproteobacteria bacterium]